MVGREGNCPALDDVLQSGLFRGWIPEGDDPPHDEAAIMLDGTLTRPSLDSEEVQNP